MPQAFRRATAPAAVSFATLIAASLATLAAAGPMPPEAKAEVDALLTRLERSGCRFNRNGTWYSGTDARAHLSRKLEFVEKKTTAATAEAFIEWAASKSSTSGTRYEVKCGDDAAVPSAVWLTQQLRAVRGAEKGAAAHR